MDRLPFQDQEVDTLRLDLLAPRWSEMMSREKTDSRVQQFRRELRRFIPVSVSTISQPCSYVSQGEEDQVLAPLTTLLHHPGAQPSTVNIRVGLSASSHLAESPWLWGGKGLHPQTQAWGM